jgi:hypothetical protein
MKFHRPWVIAFNTPLSEKISRRVRRSKVSGVRRTSIIATRQLPARGIIAPRRCEGASYYVSMAVSLARLFIFFQGAAKE